MSATDVRMLIQAECSGPKRELSRSLTGELHVAVNWLATQIVRPRTSWVYSLPLLQSALSAPESGAQSRDTRSRELEPHGHSYDEDYSHLASIVFQAENRDSSSLFRI